MIVAPVRSYSNWNQRPSDQMEQVEPYQKFFFICEGANTEVFYFKKLIDLRKKLGIHPLIDICLLEKIEEDRTVSYPLQLYAFAQKQKKNPDINFDPTRDKMVIVFDADIFEKRSSHYEEILEKARETQDILAVTNPSFELFLLLYYDGSLKSDILPNATSILENAKVGNQTFAYHLLLKRSGMNSKKNPQIGTLAENIEIAIHQEKALNQDIARCHGQLTSNIGKVISDIRHVKGPFMH